MSKQSTDCTTPACRPGHKEYTVTVPVTPLTAPTIIPRGTLRPLIPANIARTADSPVTFPQVVLASLGHVNAVPMHGKEPEQVQLCKFRYNQDDATYTLSFISADISHNMFWQQDAQISQEDGSVICAPGWERLVPDVYPKTDFESVFGPAVMDYEA